MTVDGVSSKVHNSDSTVCVLGDKFFPELAVACWCVHCLSGLSSCISPCLASIGDN